MGASADYNDNDATAAAACYFPEPDMLALELCVCAGPPVWVDLMLEELAASLVMSAPPAAEAPAPGCSLVPVAQEVDVSLLDACSLAKTAQWTMGSPPLSPVQGRGTG